MLNEMYKRDGMNETNNINMLEKAIAVIAPQHALKRAMAKQALSFINSGYGNYGANLSKKSMRGWMYHGGSAKEDIEDNIDILRQRSRDAYMGVPTAAAALKTLRTNVVASGLVPTPQFNSEYLNLSEDEATKLHSQIVREFALWAESKNCDADRVDDFYKLQRLAFLSSIMNGDAFALLPLTEPARGEAYGLKIRLIEADRICSPDLYDRLSPCTVRGRKVNQIVQGVETDTEGTVIAFWICSRHPLSDTSYVGAPEMEWSRVEITGKESGRLNILHVMDRERIGQRRGVPILAPVIETIKQLGRYTDAEITAAVVSSYFTTFVQSNSPTDTKPFGEMLPPDMQIDAADQGSIELAPGAIVSLNPGESVSFADPKHPNNGYNDFTEALLKQIGAALEISPEVMLKTFQTSYSAARGALNEFWRTCDMQRESFASDCGQPIYEEWFAEAVARGRINAPGFFSDPAIRKAYTGCIWNGPARTNLNPAQEVTAAKNRVEMGFSTAEQETAQMTGGDYRQNIKQRITEARQKAEVDKVIQQVLTEEGGKA